MRILSLSAALSPRERGRAHGEAFRGEIGTLADLRTYLTRTVGAFATDDQVVVAAGEHLPVLEAYAPDLYQELIGIAEGAATTPERIVILNHYTDLRDLNPDPAQRVLAAGDEGCSVIYAATRRGKLLGQTWDMHATAIPYAMMMRLEGAAGSVDDVWVLTLTGCLGMAGMNATGVGVAINNLYGNDARVGVVWSAIVRRALQFDNAAAATQAILATPIGSGRHFVVADSVDAFGIEVSGVERRVIYRGEPNQYIHTNHCVDPSLTDATRVSPTSTTYERYAWLQKSLLDAPIVDAADMWKRLGSDEGYPKSICTNMATAERPHGTATCAALVMQLEAKKLYAVGGLNHNVPWEVYDFAGAPR